MPPRRRLPPRVARAEMQWKYVVVIPHHARMRQAPAGGQLHSEGKEQRVGRIAVAHCHARPRQPSFALPVGGEGVMF